jgi:hypothetical protein
VLPLATAAWPEVGAGGGDPLGCGAEHFDRLAFEEVALAAPDDRAHFFARNRIVDQADAAIEATERRAAVRHLLHRQHDFFARLVIPMLLPANRPPHCRCLSLLVVRYHVRSYRPASAQTVSGEL